MPPATDVVVAAGFLAASLLQVLIDPIDDGFLLLGFVIAALLYYALGAHGRPLSRVLVVTAFGVVVGVVMTLLGPEPDPVAIGAALAVAGPALAGLAVARQRDLTSASGT